MSSQPVEFRRRDSCIACGSKNLVPVWKGTFSDPVFTSHIPSDFYSEDVPTLLADREFVRVRCGACEQTFHQSILTDEWLVALYSKWIDEGQIDRLRAHDQYGERRDTFERGRQHIKHALRIRELLGAGSEDEPRILDFGCGEGDFLEAAHVLGFSCFGVDFGAPGGSTGCDTAALRIAPTFEALDEWTTEPFDAATLFQVLEHLADPRGVLEQLAARLRVGGVLVVEVPDCTGVGVPTNAEEFHAVDPLEHINHFTPETLRNLCRSAGFEPARRIPAHVTTRLSDVLKSEASRLHQPTKTSQYFRNTARQAPRTGE
jgi:SAM-dependent methyltransferase